MPYHQSWMCPCCLFVCHLNEVSLLSFLNPLQHTLNISLALLDTLYKKHEKPCFPLSPLQHPMKSRLTSCTIHLATMPIPPTHPSYSTQLTLPTLNFIDVHQQFHHLHSPMSWTFIKRVLFSLTLEFKWCPFRVVPSRPLMHHPRVREPTSLVSPKLSMTNCILKRGEAQCASVESNSHVTIRTCGNRQQYVTTQTLSPPLRSK